MGVKLDLSPLKKNVGSKYMITVHTGKCANPRGGKGANRTNRSVARGGEVRVFCTQQTP
jgi:hypothetical protein